MRDTAADRRFRQAVAGSRSVELASQGRQVTQARDTGNPLPPVARRNRQASRRHPRILPRMWLVVLPLAMMVSSDYKLRLRTPSESLSGRPDATVLVELLVYGIVAAFLVFQVSRPPRRDRLDTPLVAAWAFAITLALSASYAVYPTLALARGVQLLVTCGLGHAIALYADRTHLHRLLHGFVVLAGCSVMLGVVHRVPTPGLEANRFNWLHVHPVMSATYLGLAAVFLVGLLMRNRQRWASPAWSSWVYGALLAVSIGGLLATRTRGAMAGCVVGCFVTAIASLRRRSRLDLLVMSAVVAFVAWLLAGGEILSFLQRGESSKALRTLSARTELWSVAWRLFQHRPIFGYGLTASRGLFFDAVGLGGAHNALVNVMVDAGVFGIISGAVVIIVLIRSARSVPRSTATGGDVPLILGGIAFLLVNSFTVEFLGTPANVANIWLFILVGWVMVLRRVNAPPPGETAPGAPGAVRRSGAARA